MSLAVQYRDARPNETFTFEFDQPVVSYVVGLAFWKFSFGSHDHHIRKVALDLVSNKIGNGIITQVNATMFDDNGHNLSISDSLVKVCAVALLGNTDGNLTLGAGRNIANGTASQALPLPGSTLAIAQTGISGFNMEYSKDHHVRRFKCASGFLQAGTSGFITCAAELSDDTGHFANPATINGFLVATNPSETGILSQVRHSLETNQPFEVEFGQPIKDAVVMLQSWQMELKKDHHVKTFGAGCLGWELGATSVKLNNAWAFMKDTTGHDEVSSKSNVTLSILAIPK